MNRSRNTAPAGQRGAALLLLIVVLGLGAASVMMLEATKTVLDRHNDGTLLFRAGSANCFVDDRCPQAIIYSSGKYLGVSVDGLPQSSAVTDNSDEQANENAVKDFMARAATDDIASIGGSFSATTAWLPLATLRSRIRASAPTAQR